MKVFLLCLSTCFSIVAHAQIHIIASDFANADDTVRLSTVLPTNVDFSSTGSNQVWDFTNLTANGQQLITFNGMGGIDVMAGYEFGPLAPPPYRASYYLPATDLPIGAIGNLLPTIQIKDAYRYFRKTNGAITSVGLSILTSMGNFPKRSDTIETFYQLPMDFGNQNTSRGYTKMDFNPFFDAKFIQHRQRESEVDGYGVVSTPYTTFNALRVHHIVQETDSFYISISGFSQWIPIPVPVSHEYEWWAKDQKLPVLKIVTSEVLGTETVTSIAYRDVFHYDLVASVKENILQLGIYPNPSTSQVYINSAEVIQSVALFDTQGKLVQEISKIAKNSTVLDVSQIEKGLYMLQVQLATGKSIQRKIQVE
jgi:hypothetical protein